MRDLQHGGGKRRWEKCPSAHHLSTHPSGLAAPSLWPQQSLKAEAQALEGSPTQLPILADMLLYYCRFAARPVLLQVYQTEVRPPCPAPPLPHLPGLQGPTPAPGEPAGLCWRSQMGLQEVHTDVHAPALSS